MQLVEQRMYKKIGKQYKNSREGHKEYPSGPAVPPQFTQAFFQLIDGSTHHSNGVVMIWRIAQQEIEEKRYQ